MERRARLQCSMCAFIGRRLHGRFAESYTKTASSTIQRERAPA
jgi:hypothetical protein